MVEAAHPGLRIAGPDTGLVDPNSRDSQEAIRCQSGEHFHIARVSLSGGSPTVLSGAPTAREVMLKSGQMPRISSWIVASASA